MLNGEAEVKDVNFLSYVQNPGIAAKKESIVDVLYRDSIGVQFICKMQVTKITGF